MPVQLSTSYYFAYNTADSDRVGIVLKSFMNTTSSILQWIMYILNETLFIHSVILLDFLRICSSSIIKPNPQKRWIFVVQVTNNLFFLSNKDFVMNAIFAYKEDCESIHAIDAIDVDAHLGRAYIISVRTDLGSRLAPLVQTFSESWSRVRSSLVTVDVSACPSTPCF